jgi:YihY family inner membrane protein
MENVRRLLGFVLHILRSFKRNNGLLLAGAIGYNTLLSMLPLFALILVVLGHVFDEGPLLQAIDTQADAIFPGRGHAVNEAFQAFFEQREIVGTVGLIAMLFFSTLGFRMLEEAMRVVFHRSAKPRSRHPIVSYLLPLGYVGLVGLGILLMTIIMVLFDAVPPDGLRIFGWTLGGEDLSVPLVKLMAFVGLIALMTSFYWVMPQTHVRPRRAFIGGIVAAVLWEAVRSILMWYFANLSLVNVIYGSLATVVVILLSLEIAAIILLLGAEVIAALERASLAGVHWYEPPFAPDSRNE